MNVGVDVRGVVIRVFHKYTSHDFAVYVPKSFGCYFKLIMLFISLMFYFENCQIFLTCLVLGSLLLSVWSLPKFLQ